MGTRQSVGALTLAVVGALVVTTLIPLSGQSFPRGSYAMCNANNPIAAEILDQPGIVGILLSQKWCDIETAKDTYDWELLDARIAEAGAAGLAVTLSLSASLLNAPDWIMAHPDVTKIEWLDRANCEVRLIPVFWDEKFHKAKRRLIKKAGQRYAQNPCIVAVMTSFANARTNDWNVPHRVVSAPGCDITVDEVEQLLDAGYSTSKMFRTGKEIIQEAASAFPDQLLKLPLGTTHRNLDGTSTHLAETIVNHAYDKFGTRFCAQMNTVKTNRPTATAVVADDPGPNSYLYLYKLLADRSPVGLQMVSAATNDPSNGCRLNGGIDPCDPYDVLDVAVDIGITYDPLFLEYWSGDARNLNLSAILERATNELQGVGGDGD